MSRKHKHPSAPPSPAVLRARVDKAAAEARFQTALDLARQLYNDQPTEEHLGLLREMYLGRARQLRSQGKSHDALAALDAVQRLPAPSPQLLERVAAEMAICGGVAQALALLQRLEAAAPDRATGPTNARIRGNVADAAIEDPKNRTALPQAWQAEMQAVLHAFRQLESGDDESARASLQSIGLRSPFLEWKLFLRGLQAYYQNDDARAVENWQRLEPERLPARLAAPYRYQIDSAFRSAQPPATQAALQKQLQALEGSSLSTRLRELRTAMENKGSLASAFRQAESLLQTLRQQAPHLVDRLAACMYWAVTTTGPEDITRYRRVFGTPAEDPNFNRLQALANDRAGNLAEAHHYWGRYEQDIARQPSMWPDGQADRARALIWLRMGHNAVAALEVDDEPDSLRFWFDRPEKLALTPSAEECYQRAAKLTPDMLEPREALLRFHLDAGHTANAEKVARQLLKHFPDHAPTLERLATLVARQGQSEEALRLLQAAVHTNPLDRPLRERLGVAHLEQARTLSRDQRFEEARQQIQSAVGLLGGLSPAVQCLLAALELKAGNPVQAEQLLQEVSASGMPAALIAYLMLVEAIRMKLPARIKTRYDQTLKEVLQGTPDPSLAAALLHQSSVMEKAGVEYLGRKTHAKKLREYAEKAAGMPLTEDQTHALAARLLEAGSRRFFKRFIRLARMRFPNNALLPLLEASSYLAQDPTPGGAYEVRRLLEAAERAARAQPEDERMKALLQQIEEQKRVLDQLDPFTAAWNRFFAGDGPDVGPDGDFGDDFGDDDG